MATSRVDSRYVLFVMVLTGCAAFDVRRTETELRPVEQRMREVAIGERVMNVTAEMSDSVLNNIIQHFQTQLGADVYGVWSIPARDDHYVVFAEGPAETNAKYGPQIFVVTHRFGAVEIRFTTGRMMDVDYIDPTFFGGKERLLMLADIGSEDSWGILTLEIAGDVINDYGVISVVRPGTIDFTESAVPGAAVFVENGRYVLKFRGEVIESPSEAPTQWLARTGQWQSSCRPGHVSRTFAPNNAPRQLAPLGWKPLQFQSRAVSRA